MAPTLTAVLHDATLAAFALHVGSGATALVAGAMALFATKGGKLHRRAGSIFFYAMLVMAAFAIYLAVVMPNQLINVFIATFAIYLVATAWMTVKRKEHEIGAAEKAMLAVSLVLSAPFVVLSGQLLLGLPTFFKSAVPLEGPVLIALYGFTVVIAIAALSDLRMVLAGGIAGAPRIARHLWRMCLGLTLATGSAFTNGVIRLVPRAWNVPDYLYFVPQFVPLVLLVFWVIRVRATRWYTPGVVAQTKIAG